MNDLILIKESRIMTRQVGIERRERRASKDGTYILKQPLQHRQNPHYHHVQDKAGLNTYRSHSRESYH